MARIHTNNFSTTTNGAITVGATTVTLNSVTGFPAVGSGDICTLTFDDNTNIEIVRVTAISGSDLTIVRAQEGTTAQAWADATPVEVRLTAATIDDKLSKTDDLIDDDTMATASATTVASSESIKAYVDTELGALSYLSNVVEDTTPNLGGNLDCDQNEIIDCLRVRTGIVSKDSDTTNNITFGTSRITLNPFNSDVANFTTAGMQLGAANARVTTILDQDTMSSDSATALATQQSIKAYVDNSYNNPLMPKAVGSFNGTGTPAYIHSVNMSATITDNGTGSYTLTLSNAMDSTNYTVIVSCSSGARDITSANVSIDSTTQFTITVNDCSDTIGGASGAEDVDYISFAVYGTLA